ncbi:hypothetical protein E3N88_42860 [Mikania micrantha]|uniref:Uncharacterized protein n=1 Tax=Mikania micrantha TaxID=192012 RepID=A0A5N6LGI6_9ASTR|nr:hypothetical protein E3N88_42860 [Mikania micrantha]
MEQLIEGWNGKESWVGLASTQEMYEHHHIDKLKEPAYILIESGKIGGCLVLEFVDMVLTDCISGPIPALSQFFVPFDATLMHSYTTQIDIILHDASDNPPFHVLMLISSLSKKPSQ